MHSALIINIIDEYRLYAFRNYRIIYRIASMALDCMLNQCHLQEKNVNLQWNRAQ